jgi:single-strand DNA-binding protein
MSYQQVIIQGNVGKDCELSYTPQGIAIAKFSIAVTKVQGRGENKTEKTTWFNVIMWREKAENLAQYIKKGDPIMIIGEVEASAYNDKNDGKARASLELTARDIVLLAKRDSSVGQRNSQEYEEVGDIPF